MVKWLRDLLGIHDPEPQDYSLINDINARLAHLAQRVDDLEKASLKRK